MAPRISLLLALCTMLSASAAPVESPSDEEEERSPHLIRAWSDPGGWHLRWSTTEKRAVFDGDLILRGPGRLASIRPIGADSTRMRIEGAPRRVRFRARYTGLPQGIDIGGTGEAISLRITVNGLEDREAVYLGREGERHPPGFPFLISAPRSSRRTATEEADSPFAEDSTGTGKTWLGLPLPEETTPRTVSIDDAWSAKTPEWDETGALLWLDELGWHLRWPKTRRASGFIIAGEGGVTTSGGSVDTLFIRGTTPPLQFRVPKPPLTAMIRLDGNRVNLRVGEAMRFPKVPRLIVEK